MSMSPDRMVDAMLAWLATRLDDAAALDAHTPLFASGLIDSLRVLELIAWVECAIGRPIEDHEIRLDNFYSVERIADVFAEEPQHAPT